jgi:hypothetical protein
MPKVSGKRQTPTGFYSAGTVLIEGHDAFFAHPVVVVTYRFGLRGGPEAVCML